MGEIVEQIAILAHDENVRLDPDQLGALYAQLGDSGAEGVVCCAMEELANRLSLIERSYYQNDRQTLAKAAKGLVGIADQIGMTKLALVARDVSACALGADDPAYAATLSRLIRLGDRSLTAVWDAQDLSV